MLIFLGSCKTGRSHRGPCKSGNKHFSHNTLRYISLADDSVGDCGCIWNGIACRMLIVHLSDSGGQRAMAPANGVPVPDPVLRGGWGRWECNVPSSWPMLLATL